MPAARIWSTASAGPVVVSASTRSGLSESRLSAETSWFRVTTGSFAACWKVAVMSRATTRSPSPRVNTISLRLPESGTIRSARSTVTFLPSADGTVTGSLGVGVSARGSTRLAVVAAAAVFRAGAAAVEPPQAVAVVRVSTANSAPASRVRKRRTGGRSSPRTPLTCAFSCVFAVSVSGPTREGLV